MTQEEAAVKHLEQLELLTELNRDARDDLGKSLPSCPPSWFQDRYGEWERAVRDQAEGWIATFFSAVPRSLLSDDPDRYSYAYPRYTFLAESNPKTPRKVWRIWDACGGHWVPWSAFANVDHLDYLPEGVLPGGMPPDGDGWNDFAGFFRREDAFSCCTLLNDDDEKQPPASYYIWIPNDSVPIHLLLEAGFRLVNYRQPDNTDLCVAYLMGGSCDVYKHHLIPLFLSVVSEADQLVAHPKGPRRIAWPVKHPRFRQP